MKILVGVMDPNRLASYLRDQILVAWNNKGVTSIAKISTDIVANATVAVTLPYSKPVVDSQLITNF